MSIHVPTPARASVLRLITCVQKLYHPFSHRKFRQQKERTATNRIIERSKFATKFENPTASEETTRNETAKKQRKNTREKKKSIAEAAGCDATESLDAKRARDGGPTACIRGNRRVGASFRLSVAIATSADLWRGERATDGKSLVRTIISRIAILQSGPSRSDALHTHRDVATHPHADFVFVCPYVTLLFVSSCHVTSASHAEEFLIVSSAFV